MTKEINWNISEYEIKKLAKFLLSQIQKDIEEDMKRCEPNNKRHG